MLQFHSLKNKILPLRQQATVRNEWLKARLDSFLPHLMSREGFDMWLIIAQEYNEDPVIMTFLREPEMSARRRTILVFTRQEDGSVERLTLSRYGQPGFYESGWNPDEESQYECLARTIQARNPAKIGINFSPTFAFGDGLSWQEYSQLTDAIGPEWMAKTASAERLCVGWLEHRTEIERLVYPDIIAMGHAIIAEAYSRNVITPGITTTDDVVWWMRQTMHDLGLRAWFQPSISIQAPDQSVFDPSGNNTAVPRTTIRPGDLLHCDMGFIYLGLATDQQQHAYVLRPGETNAPDGLKAALTTGNRLQDIHMAAMGAELTGNEVLHQTLSQAQTEGINATVYSHPLGYHGHAAGPTIGLWDQQGGVPGRGDYPIFDNTAYSIELNIQQSIPEWDNQNIRIMLEEDAGFFKGEMRWLNGRQTQFHLV
ncbi:MAG: M24 family metallopeptidase [Chloroflexota bacterium]